MISSRRPKDLTPSEKQMIYEILIQHSSNGIMQRGKIVEVASSFGVCRRTIQYVWAASKKFNVASVPVMFKSKRQGVPKRVQVELDREMMKNIPFQKRGTIRRLAKKLDVSKSKVGRWVKSGIIKPHSNAVKPDLTAANKVDRLKYCLNALQLDTTTNVIKYGSMHNVIHIDEKWFYMTRTNEKYYMLPGEVEPHRTCKSKRFIPKVMFMCAVARPQYAPDGTLIWDEKIGIFPFTEQVPAQRNSKNRVKGTLLTKSIECINREVIKRCLLTQIIPAIKARWPANASKDIFIQQDNAKPHLNNNDSDFRAAGSSDGFNIQLICQPPNSPDTNINDLGWFRAIQSLQVETASYNVDDLLKNVLISFENLSHITLNNVFLSLQGCMTEIMKVDGGNNYKLPHMKKASLINQGLLPVTLEVDEQLVRKCLNNLIATAHIGTTSYDFGGLLLSLGYV